MSRQSIRSEREREVDASIYRRNMPEGQLWLRVVTHAVHECGLVPYSKSASEFIFARGPDSDFLWICELIGLDPDELRDQASARLTHFDEMIERKHRREAMAMDWLTALAAQRLTGVPRERFYELMDAGEIESKKTRSGRMMRRSHVEVWMRRQGAYVDSIRTVSATVEPAA